MRRNRILIISFLLTVSFTMFGQSVDSPYSSYGLGDLSGFGLPNTEGMADVGIGMPNYFYINTINPAWLTYNTLTSFQVGIKSDTRTFTGAGNSVTDQSASIRYMALLFPLMPGKWTSSVSLLPYSSVNYEISNVSVIENSTEEVNNFYFGSGGLSQVSWSHGLRFFNKINIGLRASYVFGTIEKKIENFIERDSVTATDFFIRYQENISYSDILFGISTAYRHKLSDERYMSVGAIFDFPGNLNGTQQETLSRLDNTASVEFNSIVLNSGTPVSYNLPMVIGGGISYEILNKLQVGTDFYFRNWSVAQGDASVSLKNTVQFSAGGHITPDYKSVSSYLKRVTYRTGLSFQQLPYLVSQTVINDFGINFGASFPVSGLSSIDTAVKLGVRGTTDNQLIRETYVQFVFGITVNDRWFIKRKYD